MKVIMIYNNLFDPLLRLKYFCDIAVYFKQLIEIS